jgi:dynein heavy chain 1
LIDVEEQQEEFSKWIEKFPAQIDILSMQVQWSQKIEEYLKNEGGYMALQVVDKRTLQILELLADRVLTDLNKDIRQKYEQLITDLVHQREVTQSLIQQQIQSINDFAWLYHMRFYFNPKQKNPLEQLHIKLASGNFFYGFEYLGVGEKLVQTPLTDRCYLTLTQALHWRLGGSPFGPAGTGKTESVKALGSQLGRYVLVFNCDETFDGNAMGRIFVGLC